MRRIARWLDGSIRSLFIERAANVTFTFAFAALPIIGAVGAAVDYSRANSARAALQNAVDAAALTLGKEGTELNANTLDKRAQSQVMALFKHDDTNNVTVTGNLNTTSETLTLNATGDVTTTFSKVMGFTKIRIDASSTVTWGTNRKIEIALVLDNTGSMNSGGRIEALKQASRKFIDAMEKASKKKDTIKIAVVPFDTHVNIGNAYKTATWIDWSLMDGSGGTTTTTTTTTTTSSGRGGRTWDASNNYGDADDDTRFDDDRIDKDNWTGCLIDRAQPNDVLDTAPSSSSATWFPAENCGLLPMMPLTSDFNTARQMIGKMRAEGKTNLTIGLVWGWHALSQGAPLSEGAAPSREIEKYIVFLTDGLNTQNRWSTRPADIDARTRMVCDNIKAAGIKIYTIRVMEGNQALLQSCASNTTMYYNVTAANQMTPVFEDIARRLQALRIAR